MLIHKTYYIKSAFWQPVIDSYWYKYDHIDPEIVHNSR